MVRATSKARSLVALCACLFAGPDQARVASAAATGPPTVQTASRPTASKEAPPVQIFVTKLHPRSGGVEYGYSVVNRSAFPLTAFWVGYDLERDAGRMKIRVGKA